MDYPEVLNITKILREGP